MSLLCVSTHQHFGVGVVPDLDHSVPRRAVHPGSCSIQHGDGHGGGQQVDPLQHGPLGPAQRLWHGPETHLTTGRGNGKDGGRRLVSVLQALCSATKNGIKWYACDGLPRRLCVTVVDVLRHCVIIKQIFKFPFEIRTESVHQARAWINDIPLDQCKEYNGAQCIIR